MTLRIAELLPAMTPAAMLDLPWRYVMQLLIEAERKAEPGTGEAKQDDELMPCASGGYYPAGYSKLLRMFGK